MDDNTPDLFTETPPPGDSLTPDVSIHLTSLRPSNRKVLARAVGGSASEIWLRAGNRMASPVRTRV